ncbi:MAG TPA: hypothetical protein VLV31_09970 [Candidatus Acidoferrales bacterium]|nr:hypothetical protein [Candidatus Acidoferrales bacterium]
MGWVTIGIVGGVLNYCKIHNTEAEANMDGNRIAKNYGITSWESDEYDVYVAPGDGSW